MSDICQYPDCRCPFDMGPDNLCLIGKPNPKNRAIESVPAGVWEALQRLIENGGQLGPASREDALLVAKHRERLLTTTPQPADNWIKCSERLPDPDSPFEHWYSPDNDKPTLLSAGSVSLNYSYGNAPNAKWMCSGFKRPTPPEQESE